nr:DnaJ domain-containing protein [uncultured Sphingomonas sp.]
MTNHYRTLGVDPKADPAAIRGAYLALIRRYHPDGGGEDADSARAQAVTAAWEVLRDPGRRALYDESRQARFEPGSGGAALGRGPRVRGGALGRNLFLLLAAGTIGLGWWASQQPSPGAPAQVAAVRPGPVGSTPVEPAIRPDEDVQVAEATAEPDDLPRLPEVRPEPEVDTEVVLPPLPSAEPARLPPRTQVQAAQQPSRIRPEAAREREAVAAKATGREERAIAAAPPAQTSQRIDLAALERHLQLLTDQSLRFGTEAKRSRLFSSREAFLVRLRACDDDACRRDAYLRRNAEVGEIMRN